MTLKRKTMDAAWGLINMRERAPLGGIVEIESRSGEGTTVFVSAGCGKWTRMTPGP
jgi:signal transduction histidine kinase